MRRIVDQMLGHQLVTHQTAKDGVAVSKVMIAEAKDLARETYLAIVLDRSSGGPVLVGRLLVLGRTQRAHFRPPVK